MTSVWVEVTATEGGWQIDYVDAQGGTLAAPRRLGAVGAPPFTFPQPPGAETAAIAADELHRPLVTAADEEPLIDALAELGARDSGSRIVERIGRYLHAVLFGAAWPQVLAERGGELRLELCLPKHDAAFGRFPWELIHDGDGFLALSSGTTIVRRVDSPAKLVQASAPLDVLFVVGSGLRDDVIRPAAEYLGLVQSLKARAIDRRLRPRLLLEATTDRLAAALEDRPPAVIHFMAHGRFEGDRPYVEIQGRDGAGVDKLYPQALAELLKDATGGAASGTPSGSLPIVVLSACNTAAARETAKQGEAAAPFAATLVASGVPLVVGMTGPVGDLACRLFTRAFYGALLEGQDAATATAAGRRAAVVHGGYDVTSAYDWALPTLFLSRGQESPRLEISEAPQAGKRQKLARELEPGSEPVFCDRLPVLAASEALLATASVQKRLLRGPERQTVAISSEFEAAEAGGEQLGRTWALRAIAARAALAGHVPILVSKKYLRPSGEDPGDWRSFVQLLFLAMRKSASELGVEHRPCAAARWLLSGGERPESLPEELDFVDPGGEISPDDMAAAVRHDLLELLAVVHAQLPAAESPRCRVLLLIDDLHRMGELAADLLGSVFGAAGLRLPAARSKVRIVFTWVRKGQAYQATIRRIIDWLGDWNGDSLELSRFQDLEERLAYQHLLFHYRTPLTVASGLPDSLIDNFYAYLSHKWEGVPSNLRTADALIEDYLHLQESGLAAPKILVPASDEDVVEKWLRAEAPL